MRFFNIKVFYLFYFLCVAVFLFVIPSQAEDYLWIGGTGNWSDTLQWQSDSGGLPGPTDNVFFNAASFPSENQFLTIDTVAFCQNMDWSEITQPVNINGTGTLRISGSLILNPLITNNFTGDIYFVSQQGGNNINPASVSFSSDIYFDGAGSWALSDSLIAENNLISLIKGGLNTMNHYIRVKSFKSDGESTGLLKMGNTLMEITGSGTSWKTDDQLIFLKDNSTLIFNSANPKAVVIFDGGGISYGNVLFKQDALIKGDNSFSNLVFNAGHRYRILSGSVQTIVNEFYARGCSGIITIEASGTTQATFAKSGGNADISFVALRSIKTEFTPGYYLVANHSIDLGNNNGPVIFKNGRNMHWVNGSGMWSDTLHWNSSPVGEDADCLPLPYDNVKFDDNSFEGADTVVVDLKEIKVNHMTWNTVKQPVFKDVSSESMTLFGSLEFAPMMKNEFSGITFFRDTLGGQTIKTSSVGFNNDLVFDGKSGGWNLVDSLTTEGNLYLSRGDLDIVGNYLKCRTFRSDSAFGRALHLNDARIDINMANPSPAWSLNSSSLNFDAGNSEIVFNYVSSTMENLGEDTIRYNDVTFTGVTYTDRIKTHAETAVLFRKVIFGSNATIEGNNQYDTLSCTPGNYYELKSGSVQTIVNDIWPTGNCEGPILLRSSTPGDVAYLEKPEDTLSIEYTSIYDIETLGEAIYIANNSVDLGNNLGWDTIANTAAGKLFWVGGTGNWEDTDHWSLTSGGPGGECIPSAYDTVVFDALSFTGTDQKVTVNLNNALAHDMRWTDALFAPEFDGSYNTLDLRIFGSLYLNEDMNFTFPGNIHFESRNTGEIISTQNVKFHNKNNNVYFSGPGGEWNLDGPFDLGVSEYDMNTLFLNYGNLFTNSMPVTCFNFYSNTNGERLFAPDHSNFLVKNNWIVNGSNFEIADNSSLIVIDSGYFLHRYGNYFPYHDLVMNSDSLPQNVTTSYGDSIMFYKVLFKNDGLMNGKNATLMAGKINFMQNGSINEEGAAGMNTYILDSLVFRGVGKIYGNDTAGWVRFDSTGLISGAGEYENLKFYQDGNISGNNIFDTLTFCPAYTYILEGLAIQDIRKNFNIKGNNCDAITILSSDETKAVVRKNSGYVKGEHLILKNINAVGNAVFDAGYFSENIDMSNDGWLFQELPYTYDLGKDISMLEGDTVYICAEFFNGNASTSYNWILLETGETVGTDSCLMVTQKGNYVLTVNYGEGSGCTKQDTIFIGCHLGVDISQKDVSCFGFENGEIEPEIMVGSGPITFNWSSNGVFYSNDQNLYGIPAGTYKYIIKDSLECVSKGQVVVTQPDSLKLQYFKTDACYAEQNGTISLVPSGGTSPYIYTWSNDSSTSYLTDLSPEIYSVSLTDINACPAIDTAIEIVELPEITVGLSGSDLICYHDSSGYINIDSISGGTGNYIAWDWLKNDSVFQTGPGLDMLMPGFYTLNVEDDNGCSATRYYSIEEPEDLALSIISIAEPNDIGSIDLSVSGGTEPYSFVWNTGATTEDIEPLDGGNYSVDVYDNNGCNKTGSIFLEVHYRIYAPTGFSPNGDGINDVFEIKGLGTDLIKYKFAIYNRYGEQVFYTQDVNENWNGRLNNDGPEMPPEVYTWLVEMEFANGNSAVDSGTITLLR